MMPAMSDDAPEPRPVQGSPDELGAVRRFLDMARTETRRYGDDDTIWVRELCQNARDACCATMTFAIEGDTVTVDDDGCGMSRAVVSSHLLRLFSSTKTSAIADPRARAAGCFGVGFWSVLLSGAHIVEVDTHDGRMATGLTLDVEAGAVREHVGARAARGTTIRLRGVRLGPSAGASAAALRAAVVAHAAYVLGVGGAAAPRVIVRSGGAEAVVNRALDLSGIDGIIAEARLSGPGFDGVIGLSTSPRVELFAHGLRVVEASSLAAIVPSLAGHQRRGLGIALRVDVPGLTVLIDRRTVVEDATVRALVRACSREAERLEARLLDELAPLPWWRRGARAIARVTGQAGGARPALLALIALVVGVSLGAVVAKAVRPSAARSAWPPVFVSSVPSRSISDAVAGLGPPRIDVRGRDLAAFELATHNVSDDLVLEVLDVPDEREGLRRRDPGQRLARRASPRINDAPVASAQLMARGVTPLPSSQVLWPIRANLDGDAPQPIDGSPAGAERPVRVSQRELPIWEGEDGLPYVSVGDAAVKVNVFFGVLDRRPWVERVARADDSALVPLVLAGRGGTDVVAINAIAEAVAGAVRYAADDDAAARFANDSRPLIEKSLALGLGDCDVINTVLVRALQQAGFHARLARGLIVRDDIVANELHAWAEVELVSGGRSRWLTVDASPQFATPQPAPRSASSPVTPTRPAAQVLRPTTAAVATAPPPGPTPSAAGSLGERAAVAGSAVVGLSLVCAGVAFARRRARAIRPSEDDDDARLAVFLAALQSGAAAAHGLLHRPVLPTTHGLISLREARERVARGRIALGVPTGTLSRRVCVVDPTSRRARALLRYLPALSPAALVRDLATPEPLRAAQARIDSEYRGVALRRGVGDGVRERLLETRDGCTHQILVGDDIIDGDPNQILPTLLAEATSLRGLRRRPVVRR